MKLDNEQANCWNYSFFGEVSAVEILGLEIRQEGSELSLNSADERSELWLEVLIQDRTVRKFPVLLDSFHHLSLSLTLVNVTQESTEFLITRSQLNLRRLSLVDSELQNLICLNQATPGWSSLERMKV